MRKQPVKHEKHEKMAITAFIITLAISIIAFYYIYQQNVQFGRTVEGVQDYACSVYLRENPKAATCPVFVAVETEMIDCCCRTQGGFGLQVQALAPESDRTGIMAQRSCIAKCASTTIGGAADECAEDKESCVQKYKDSFFAFGQCDIYKIPMPG